MAGLTGFSSKPFVVTFAGGGSIDACSFAPKQDLTAGVFPVSVAAGDFDGDGKADMAVANVNNNMLSLFRNTSSIGSISYAAKIDITTGATPDHISVDDLDGDGKLDLVLTDGGGISVFRNTSTGAGTISFAARIAFSPGGSDTRHSAIDDFDKDGKPDIVITNYTAGANTISVFRNSSSGPGNINFDTEIFFAAGLRPSSVSTGDLDGDGKTDIALVSQDSNLMSVFLNTSTGAGNISYSAKVDYATGTNPVAVSIGDLDNDGKSDIAVGYSLGTTSSAVSVFRNVSSGTGNISYAPKIDFTIGLLASSVSIGDIDGDGKPDLAVTNVSSSNVSILRNTSTGVGSISFATKVDFITASNSQSGSICDFDGDGKPDLAVTTFFSVSVFRNAISPGPTITSFTPTSGDEGTAIVITGSNFDAVAANNVITFNGTPATVIFSTTTTITTTVPTGATTGTISVTAGCNTATSSGNFTVTAVVPTITSFTPASGPVGTSVTITGTDFTGATGVSFGGTPASSFTLTSTTSIDAIVGAGATGSLSVTTPGGTATSPGFVFIPTPTITSFTPTSSIVGDPVTIFGSNFDPTLSNNIVKFNGTTAVATASTSTSITTTVPTGAATGTITVTVGSNIATSATVFTVITSSITITTQPSDAVVCDGVNASFSVVATGAANLTYQWQFSTNANPLVFTDVSNGSGYSNATTSTLSINTQGKFGEGRYRCRINGDLATELLSNDEGLFINPLPTPPITASNSLCGSGGVTLNASGGVNGQYRWYTVATGGTALSVEVNSSYTTPSISSTTTYYVSLNDGTCESTRTAVVAIINPVPAKPLITISGSTTLCPGQSVTLSAPVGFTYSWSTGATSQQIIVSTAGSFSVQVTSAGCTSVSSDPIAVSSGVCNQPPVIAATTAQSGVEGSVTLTLTGLLSDPDNNLDLSTLRIIQQPSSGAPASINSNNELIINYKGLSFAGIDELTIEVCDLSGECVQRKITIDIVGDIIVYNAVSPNDDNKNPAFILKYIDAIEETKNNKVSIFNRWGDLIWEGVNYNNSSVVFTGTNKNGNELPTGTYFYKIEFTSGRKTDSGYLSLKR